MRIMKVFQNFLPQIVSSAFSELKDMLILRALCCVAICIAHYESGALPAELIQHIFEHAENCNTFFLPRQLKSEGFILFFCWGRFRVHILLVIINRSLQISLPSVFPFYHFSSFFPPKFNLKRVRQKSTKSAFYTLFPALKSPDRDNSLN